ncbi:iron-containing alcohol dehydrogenase [Streptomyces sp. NPDC020707]|uniref:iron-containing alcohol dehydrogenase n=1 Tax=Streptomyces TaxID=1883 RepID=UPI0028D51F75|nr:iron-containing alcohol dehydrogenase [Streptomyces sp. DSM 40484]
MPERPDIPHGQARHPDTRHPVAPQPAPGRAVPSPALPPSAGTRPTDVTPHASGTLASGTLRLPARVHFGHGSRALLPDLVALHGSRVLLVADPFLSATPYLDELSGALASAGLAVRIHSDITPELPAGSLDAAAAVAREYDTEVVLAVGGGSALDAAKLIALLCVHEGPLSRYYGENLVPGPVLPVVAVPTTAGTGSEVTPVAVVSDPDRELKVGISSPFLVPAAAVVDPDLTLGAPRAVTAHSGIDALVHAAESYTARSLDTGRPPDTGRPVPDPAPVPGPAPVLDPARVPVFTGRNPLAEPMALRAAALLGPWLPVAVREPSHRQARHQVALGALSAGIAFGSTGTHLCHALQYAVGALTRTPHGLGTGLLLPYVLDTLRAEPEGAERVAAFGAALEQVPTHEASPGRTVARVAEINRAIGVPASLREIGVGRDQFPRLADLALKSARLLAIAPVEPTRDLLLDIIRRAHAGTLDDRTVA